MCASLASVAAPTLSRRQFLGKSTVIAAATALGWQASSRGADIPDLVPNPAPSWCDKPMRWGQLTLVEDDPGQYDPGFWLDYFHRTHCDAVCLSAGGCVAYYPTQIPFHHRSAWLGNT